ncbi:hypothetical protein ILUMI_22785 [Ignelater luminosus]|uniref:Mitochondrial pyruvate carrier n=1 Tax=Ignelater luminosus TaxID=2038154 RepID=A0A8K0CFY1_IGNLU|nr:hypothetical protein ILUMI_22785 [Ignelater luminosus]
MTLLYRRSIAALDKLVPPKLQPLWNHAAGPKTVFFWAPIVKWGLVIAGIGDLSRPADQLSIRQSGSIAVTGYIWGRYCLVIIPKNYPLCAVNLFIGITQTVQLFRAIRYQQTQREEQENKIK